jgi:hypothetical protein
MAIGAGVSFFEMPIVCGGHIPAYNVPSTYTDKILLVLYGPGVRMGPYKP